MSSSCVKRLPHSKTSSLGFAKVEEREAAAKETEEGVEEKEAHNR